MSALPEGTRIRYGCQWGIEYTDLDIELTCFRHAWPVEKGGLGKEEHFWNIVGILWGDRNDKKRFQRNPWSDDQVRGACNHKILSVTGCANASKCLGPHVPVLMHDGSVRAAKDIKLGDRLMGERSGVRTVVATRKGSSNMVRIVPNIGDAWECNDDHVLTLKRTWSGPRGEKRVGEVIDIPVREYAAKSRTFKKQYRLTYSGADFPNQPVEFDPRAYGIWLGDGKTGAPHIFADDSEVEVIEYITKYFTSLGMKVTPRLYSSKSCRTYLISNRYKRGGFNQFVRRSSPDGSKRILPEYLKNSRKVRLELLAGLIDSDGHASKATGTKKATRFSIGCAYPLLAKDIAYLARSLGFRVGVTPRKVICNGHECDYEEIVICGATHLIPTLRKKTEARHRHLSCNDAIGFKVEEIGEGEWTGFTVDGNGRFLLGDFTITHNSDTFAIWAIVNFIARPAHTLILITSTSLTESRQRIWGSVEEYWNAVPGLPGKLVSALGMIRYRDPVTGQKESDRCGIKLVAGDKTNERDAVQKLIGIKRQEGALILIADELPELSPAILGSLSNLTSQPFFQLIGLGNAKSQFDPHGELCTPKGGWNSVSDQDGGWETELGYCIHFDAEKSPNVLAKKILYPFLPKISWVKDQAEKHGVNSLQYWRMVRGFWCPDGATEGVYTESDITLYECNVRTVKWAAEVPIGYAGLDLGFTNGGDESVLQFAEFGQADNGIQTLRYTDRVVLKHDVSIRLGRAQQIADQVKLECQKRDVLPIHFGFDKTGGGSAYGDVFAERWSRDIYAVEFGGAPTDMMVGQLDAKPANELYYDRASEIWYVGREFMRGGNIRGVDIEMSRDLLGRRGTTIKRAKGVVMAIETKRETKKRLKRSPDKGEAALIVLDTVRARANFQPNIAKAVGMISTARWRQFVGEQEAMERRVVKHLAESAEEMPQADPNMSYADALNSLKPRSPILVIEGDFELPSLM